MTGTYRDVRLSFWSLYDRKTLAHNQHEFRYLISELQYAEFPEKSKNADFRIFDQKQKIAYLKLSPMNVKVFIVIFEFPGCITFDFCKKMSMRDSS